MWETNNPLGLRIPGAFDLSTLSNFGTGNSNFGQGLSLGSSGLTGLSPTTAATNAWGSNATNFGNTGALGGLGFNLPTAQLALGGLTSLGSLIQGFGAQRLARDQFNFTRDTTNTNLNNQIKSYNTALEDRATSRAAVNGTSQSELASYLERNKASR